MGLRVLGLFLILTIILQNALYAAVISIGAYLLFRPTPKKEPEEIKPGEEKNSTMHL